MADDQTKKAIVQNTKAIEELTKKFKESNGNAQTPSEEKKDGVVTGINAVDRKIKDLKESFNNNTTVKFLKDPVGTIGGGLKDAFDPLLSIPKKIGDSFKKIGGFFSNIFGGGKNDKKTHKLLERSIKIQSSIDKNFADFLTVMLGKTAYQISTNEEVASAIKKNGERVAGPIQKLSLLRAKSADAIKGFFMKKLGVDFLFRKINQKFFKESADNEKTANRALSSIAGFGEDAALRLLYIQDFFKDKFESIVKGISGSANDGPLGQGEEPSANDIGGAVGKALTKSEAKKDQRLNEEKKDNKLFQTNLFEGLLGGLSKAIGLLSFKGLKGGIKESGFSLIEFFKKALGGGAIAIGATLGGVGAGIAGFFKALGAGFIYLGANLPLFAKGAASLALIGLSLVPWAGSLLLLNKALDGFTFKKVGVFTGMLLATGAAIGGFALAVSSGVGLPIVAAAIGLLALAGTALIPFGYAISLAGKGMEKAAVLFDNLGEVGWDKISVAGKAIESLAKSFNKLAFGGLIDNITGGGFTGFVSNLSEFGNQAGNVIALSNAMDKLAATVEPFQNMQFQTNIGDLLKNISKYGEDFDSNNWWDVNMDKASEGLDKFLSVITTHLKSNASRSGVLEGMNRLLENTVTTGNYIGNADNMSAFQTGAVSFRQGQESLIAPITNVVDNSSTSSSSTTVVQEQHIGPNTMSFIANYKLAQ